MQTDAKHGGLSVPPTSLHNLDNFILYDIVTVLDDAIMFEIVEFFFEEGLNFVFPLC